MMQSLEYADLRWMPPRAYGTGRDGKAVRYIVIHYTAGAERSTSAEDGAVYDQNRTDGTSTHYFVDSDSVVQCVHTANRGNAARHKGNRLGIQYELCGTVQTREQWLDGPSRATLQNAARQVARDCKKYDIPVRRLSVLETRRAWDDFPNGPRGIVGHVDCTNAYPEDGGDHTDPGPQFPWDVFLGMVRAEMEEDDMLTADEIWQRTYGTTSTAKRWPATPKQSMEAYAALAAMHAKDSTDMLAKFVADEASRDAQLSATLAGMQTALSALASAHATLTDEQVRALSEQVRQAAVVAGAEAVSAVAEKLDSLRAHLGDRD